MDYSKIIEEMQTNISNLLKQLDQLKQFDFETSRNVYLTRQEAADYIGKSLRQLDRDCIKFEIPKLYRYGGIRIRKSDLMIGMGHISEPEPDPNISEFERIRRKHWAY